MSNRCLNCNAATENNFCSICGQKNSTHRFSLKHFIVHDFIHGVFHLDKGFLFTVKELFTRPGHSIREFIQGKRVNYFNYFTLIVLIYAIGHFLGKIPQVTLGEIFENTESFRGKAKLHKEFGKYIILAGIPIYAFISYLIFLRSRQNYTEHLVMTMYFTSAIVVFNYIPVITTLFTSSIKTVSFMIVGVTILECLYYFWFFSQYFSTFNYSKTELAIRCIMIVILIIIVNSLINLTIGKIGAMYMD